MSIPSQGHAVGQYQSIGNYSAVSAADKLRLVQLMMQGVQDRVAKARGHIARGEISSKGEQIGRAIQLIDGLLASLDDAEGGDIARNLAGLYEYMMRRLLVANANDDSDVLDEVSGLMKEVKEAWDEVLHQSESIIAAQGA